MNTQSESHIRACLQQQADDRYAIMTTNEKFIADTKLRILNLKMSIAQSQIAIHRETEKINSNTVSLEFEKKRLQELSA